MRAELPVIPSGVFILGTGAFARSDGVATLANLTKAALSAGVVKEA